MPPPIHAARTTFHRYYQNTQDAALDAFLASRNLANPVSDPQPQHSEKRGHPVDERSLQRVVRGRLESDTNTAGDGGSSVSAFAISVVLLLTWPQNFVLQPSHNNIIPTTPDRGVT